MKFWKAHGLGNDYLVLEAALALDADLVRDICDRHRGLGGDGILEPKPSREGADYGVRIWNPDGSIAEKSGNGLRIFARWLHDERAAPESFSVSTDACVVGCKATADSVSVEMGRPSFAPDDVPVVAEGELIDGPIELASVTLTATAVGMGNPHCVIFRNEPLDSLPWRKWGAELERHPRFPNRTNVQVARVIEEHEVEIRIFERGAGETQASGSSSCAVAAAGVRTGRLRAGRIRVRMPGGVLYVTVSDDGILLEGPVEGIGRFELDSLWLRARS
ncbi:MAG TPA: diaminopimelate epimerase [Polyangiaceae bacterium]|nr:diaminopimelate epimerase [Polyangiaceae bacterium]